MRHIEKQYSPMTAMVGLGLSATAVLAGHVIESDTNEALQAQRDRCYEAKAELHYADAFTAGCVDSAESANNPAIPRLIGGGGALGVLFFGYATVAFALNDNMTKYVSTDDEEKNPPAGAGPDPEELPA
ncbi:MAG: hypothetical protein M3P98_03330 [bacterium]|nr:hypothetical protein [bacterium]